MVILIITLLLFESVDVSVERDSTVQQILQGRWEDAVTNAKFVLTHQPEDDLLLGLLRIARQKRIVSELNPQFLARLEDRESKILQAWETLHKKNPTNKNILQVLARLYTNINTDKVFSYANKILELDSLNAFAYFIIGHTHQNNEEYDKAMMNFQRAWSLDTTSTDCMAVLANLYLIKGTYDSAVVYYRKIPYDDSLLCGMHIGEIVCALQMKNITTAESLITKMKNIEPAGSHIPTMGPLYLRNRIRNDLDKIDNYLNNITANTLAPDDSFIVAVPLILREVCLVPPRNLAVILKVDGIKIVPQYFADIKPKPVHIPAPRYPASARREGHEGKVIIKALVDIDGTIRETEVMLSSGLQDLDRAAIEVAKKAVFEPAMQFGRPVRVWVSIPIEFRLIH